MAQDNKPQTQSSSNSWIDEAVARMNANGWNFVRGNGEGAMETFFSNPENIIWSNESKKPSKHTNASCQNTKRKGAGQTAGPGTPSRCCMSSKDKSLQEYMQKVRDCLIETYGFSRTESDDWTKDSENDWQEYLNAKLTPKGVAYGLASGLL